MKVFECVPLIPLFCAVSFAQTPTLTALVPITNPTAGTPLTIAASVVPDPGPGFVAFVDGHRSLGSAPLANGQARLITSFVTGGKHAVRAVFRGNATHAPSASADLTVTVQATAPKSVAGSKELAYGYHTFVDLNADGRTDLVQFDTTSVVAVELLQTNGSFGPAISHNIGAGRLPLGVADFNNDGKVDIAAAENGKIVVVSGDGAGGFTQDLLPAPQTPLEPAFPGWGPFLAGDFNRDGAADLALVAYSFSVYNGSQFVIYFGNGSGGFSLALHSSNPKGHIGDANGDNILDFAFDTWFRGTKLFYKTGCLLFLSSASAYQAGPECGATDVNTIRAGDINNDGKPDLVYDNSVRLGTAPGVFAPPVPANFGAGFVFSDLLDFNNDGNIDALGIANADVVVRLGNGAGVFPSSVTLSAAGGPYQSVQDVNGDGVLDIVYTGLVKFGSTRNAPVVDSVSLPSTLRSGSEQTVTISVSDQDGAADLKTAVLKLFGDSTKQCEITVDIATKSGSFAEYVSFAEGAGWKRTKYCAFNPQSISTAASGHTVNITLTLVLQAEAQGSLQVAARAIDTAGADSGFKAFGAITVTHTNRRPQPVSVTAAGQNPVVFTVTMSDPDGLGNFATAELLIGDSASPENACYIAIDPQSRVVRLMGDSGTEWLGAYMASNRRMANSQCATSSGHFQYLSSTGQQITFQVPVEFLAFHGTKNIYLRAIDFSSGDSGFHAHGQIDLRLPPAVQPTVVDLQPRIGSGATATLTGQFRHPNGVTGHYLAYVLVLPTPTALPFTAQGSCLMEYNRISNGVRLIDDAGTGWLGPASGVTITPTAGVLSNTRCSVNVSKVVVSLVGEMLTVTFPAQLNASMGPVLATFIQSIDVTGKPTPMTQVGNWTIPGATQTSPGPRVVSLSYTPVEPDRINVGITYTHSESLSKVDLIHLRVATSISSNQYCHIVYSPALKALNLVDDTGTMLLGWRTVNTGALINSRCWAHSFDLATGESQGNAAFSFSVQRTPGNLPGQLIFYVNAFDRDGRLTHWVQAGTWP